MWTAIGLALKAGAAGAWSLLRAIPAWVYLFVLAAVLIAWGQHRAYARGHAAGTAAARADLVPKLVIALDQLGAEQQIAADAEGRARVLDAGLQQCIGARVAMDAITSAVLTEREQQRAAAVRALNTTRKELANAYASSNDRCAAEPVPADVVRVLDLAAFGQAGAHTYPIDRDSGAGLYPGAFDADRAYAGAAAAGAYSAYSDLAAWIAYGWAPALQSCNADKASIARLRAEP